MNKTSFRYLPSLVTAGICLMMLVQAANAQGTGAAEVAAARGVPSSLDHNVVGHTVGGDYQNEYLGIEIRHIPGWTSMSRGMMNVNEAAGREALGMKAGANHSGNRVFGMHDEAGSSVIVAIVRIPVDAETDATSLKTHLVKMTKSQLPNAQVADETTLLDDSAHHFAALRINYSGGWPTLSWFSLELTITEGAPPFAVFEGWETRRCAAGDSPSGCWVGDRD